MLNAPEVHADNLPPMPPPPSGMSDMPPPPPGLSHMPPTPSGMSDMPPLPGTPTLRGDEKAAVPTIEQGAPTKFGAFTGHT
ncbi:unnamed protein product [Strongylus vulgaris]|uniref:Uncharacterized protein n=1 Tax=Strongylus vulgaris TaxID=40348 RepID=A0A3P7LPG4_STRVU|nr:unnamed protein product [Strongylus vulgaris]